MQVTKDTLIGDVLDFDAETAQFFFEIGMHCLGCPHSRGESIGDACMVHGTDADALIKRISCLKEIKKRMKGNYISVALREQDARFASCSLHIYYIPKGMNYG